MAARRKVGRLLAVRRRSPVVVALAGLALAGGCGSDTPPDPTTSGQGSQTVPRSAAGRPQFPETLAAVIVRDDPDATGRGLRGLGYRVIYHYVRANPQATAPPTEVGDPLPAPSERATLVTRVARPPKGTVVLSVLNSSGGRRIKDPPSSILVEVARPEDADL